MKNDILDNLIVLIPAYRPNNTLYSLVYNLSLIFKYIIIIDDGSGVEYNEIFSRCVTISDNILFYRNVVNMGKGRAIKNGINYSFNVLSDEIDAGKLIGFVTVDADGQHTLNDICKCCNVFQNNNDKLVLGSRSFDKNVPLRSKFGNTITSFVMRIFYGIILKDTQTGLRVFSINDAKFFSSLNGERYEYEILMLIESSKRNIKIIEEDIETIYIDDNSSSHFNPIIDSYKIYKVILSEFFKFSFSGLFSFFVDISMFSLFIFIFKTMSEYYVIIAAVLARMISSLVNFTINKNIVFCNTDFIKNTILKYYTLVMVVLLISSLSTYLISSLFNGYEIIIKICVDFIIYFIDYQVQRMLFKQTDSKH